MSWHRIAAIPSLLAGTLIGAITVLITINVIGRYSGLFTLTWIEEAARNMFIWLIFLGAAVAVQRNSHFRLALIDRFFRPRGAVMVRGVAHASLAVLGIGLVVFGVDLVAWVAGQSTTSLGVPLPVVYAAVPISGVLFVVYALWQVISCAKEFRALA